MGRRSVYRKEYAKQARALCLLNYTDERIADFFGIAESTFYQWQEEHPELKEALRYGKAEADQAVVSALLQRAVGYEYTAERPIANAKAKDGYVIAQYTEHMPPDVGAAKHWLSVRHPDLWRERGALDTVLGDGAVQKVTIEVERASTTENT